MDLDRCVSKKYDPRSVKASDLKSFTVCSTLAYDLEQFLSAPRTDRNGAKFRAYMPEDVSLGERFEDWVAQREEAISQGTQLKPLVPIPVTFDAWNSSFNDGAAPRRFLPVREYANRPLPAGDKQRNRRRARSGKNKGDSQPICPRSHRINRARPSQRRIAYFLGRAAPWRRAAADSTCQEYADLPPACLYAGCILRGKAWHHVTPLEKGDDLRMVVKPLDDDKTCPLCVFF